MFIVLMYDNNFVCLMLSTLLSNRVHKQVYMKYNYRNSGAENVGRFLTPVTEVS